MNTTNRDAGEHPTRRGRMQFRLRTIFVLTLIVAAYFGGRLPYQRRAKEAERQADKNLRLAIDNMKLREAVETEYRAEVATLRTVNASLRKAVRQAQAERDSSFEKLVQLTDALNSSETQSEFAPPQDN